MVKKLIAVLMVFSLVMVTQGDDKKPVKKGKKRKFAAKCPVSGKPAKRQFSVAYRKAKVFMCCPNCPKAFSAEKHATKANHQLAVTRQAYQVKCPFSGGKLNKKTAIAVSGAKVAFCCNMCKAKAQKVKGAEQVALLFATKSFDKGFKIGKKAKKKKKKA